MLPLNNLSPRSFIPTTEQVFGRSLLSSRTIRWHSLLNLPDLLARVPAIIDTETGDASAVRDALLATFQWLLEHPAPVAQYAGLHGLGHLKHPRGAAAIDAYLATHSELNPSQFAYAEAAKRGEVL
jgi:hypothetical protein